jgi:hypothetical protein
VRSRPWLFISVALGVFALDILVPPLVLSIARQPVTSFTVNPLLSTLPGYLTSGPGVFAERLGKAWGLALFWFSSDGQFGIEWGFAVTPADLARFVFMSFLVAAYFALWLARRDRATAWGGRAGTSGGVLAALGGTFGLPTGRCTVRRRAGAAGHRLRGPQQHHDQVDVRRVDHRYRGRPHRPRLGRALAGLARGQRALMRLGISLTSSHAVTDPREGARWMIERAAAAERAGLDSLFVGDHHATPGPYYQNVPMLARMLAEWADRPAGCLFLLPLWNPVLIAEQVGTLAAIACGRFIFQCGLGDGQAQFLAMGANNSAPRRSRDADIIKRLAGETVSPRGPSSSRTRGCPLAPRSPASTGWGRTRAWPSIGRRASPTAGSLPLP